MTRIRLAPAQTRPAFWNAALKVRLDRADRALFWGVGAMVAVVPAVAASV